MPAVLLLSAFSCLEANAQDKTQSQSEPAQLEDTALDTIIVTGTANWAGHKGMDAFIAGDFKTAEIIFEREFISLKRAENGRYNAAVDNALSINRASNTAQATSNATASNGAGGPSLSNNLAASSANISGNASSNRKTGRNILNDGVLSPQDFAFTKYMSGLSEIKLGKYQEAKKSLKTSLFHMSDNPDGRMRLGLIYLMEDDFDKAAKQLEKLEKRRVKCKKVDCDEYAEILESASILATQISNKIRNN